MLNNLPLNSEWIQRWFCINFFLLADRIADDIKSFKSTECRSQMHYGPRDYRIDYCLIKPKIYSKCHSLYHRSCRIYFYMASNYVSLMSFLLLSSLLIPLYIVSFRFRIVYVVIVVNSPVFKFPRRREKCAYLWMIVVTN